MSGDRELATRVGNGYVPMTLYLADRRELREWMAELSADVKTIRRELDRDDGAHDAEDRQSAAEEARRRTFAERVWDVARTALAAALGALAALISAGFH